MKALETILKNHFYVFFLFMGIVACSPGQEDTAEGDDNTLAFQQIPNVTPRNVIFILSDDHRYDYMSFMHPNDWLQTPNLDRIAREGVHIRNAFVTTSLCSPSRASILTGQFSHVHQVVDNQSDADPNLIYFPQYLQEAGYQTAFVGKWHMGHDTDEPRKGFDRWVSFKGQGVYYNPTLNVDGEQVTHGDSAYISEVLTDYAIDFMEQRNPENPFFLYLSHKAVHGDFFPAKDDRLRYHGKEISYPQSVNYTNPDHIQQEEGVNYEDMPEWVKQQRYSWHGVDYAYHRQNYLDTVIWRYTETLHSLDTSIGNLLDYLDEKGLAESTMIIYMGDNGFSLGEHGLIDKRHAYEESMRVPMLARCPEIIQPGTQLNQMIQNIDVGPTILAMAGIETPAQMNGRSFLPLLQGESVADWRQRIYYEYYWESAYPQTPTIFAVRTDTYKYIFNQGVWDPNELYNLETDPAEVNNLIKSPEQQERALQLKEDLWQWLEETQGMQIPLKKPVMKRLDWEYKGNP